MRWNILITGGRVLDPFQGIDGIRDVAIAGTRVAEVGENLPADQARTQADRSVVGRGQQQPRDEQLEVQPG